MPRPSQKGRQRNPLSAPQLWVWIGAVLMPLLLLSATYDGDTSPATNAFNESRLDQWRDSSAAEVPKIAILGTSLVQFGFFKDQEMEAFAFERGKSIRFLRFTYQGGRPDDFTRILDKIIDFSPDLIAVEANMVGINTSGFTRFGDNLVRHRIAWMTRIKRSILQIPFTQKIIASWINVDHSQSIDRHGNFSDTLAMVHQDLGKQIVNYHKFATRYKNRTMQDSIGLNGLFDKAIKAGIRVALIDLPRSRLASEVIPAQIMPQLRSLMNQYEVKYNIHYVAFRSQLSSDYYYDLVHFNNRGRTFFSDWFVSQVPYLLNGSHP